MLNFRTEVLSAKTIIDFQQLVREYYRGHARSYPWREDRCPYKILVSEFMLQQTGTDRVLPKYMDFINRYPALTDLAAASLLDILSVWQGLGYNRRAKYLLESAVAIRDIHDGIVPSAWSVLKKLPGIGEYSAKAIATFAYGRPLVFVETNIRRVIIHFFFKGEADISDKEVKEVLGLLLYKDSPRDWYYALMDYGAYLKKNLPNQQADPNLRGKHYTRQNKFTGSDRQVRGKIIRLLTETRNGSLDRDAIYATAGFSYEKVAGNLLALENEGLIACEGSTVRVGLLDNSSMPLQ